MKYIKSINQVINESMNEKIIDEFIDHFEKNKKIDIKNVPKELINKFPDWAYEDTELEDFEYSEPRIKYKDKLDKDEYIYSGVEKGRDVKNIRSWTLDEETAAVFSEKYNNGVIIKLSQEEFEKIFKYFISMDVLCDYIYYNKLNNERTNKYYSESEIVVLENNNDI